MAHFRSSREIMTRIWSPDYQNSYVAGLLSYSHQAGENRQKSKMTISLLIHWMMMTSYRRQPNNLRKCTNSESRDFGTKFHIDAFIYHSNFYWTYMCSWNRKAPCKIIIKSFSEVLLRNIHIRRTLQLHIRYSLKFNSICR